MTLERDEVDEIYAEELFWVRLHRFADLVSQRRVLVTRIRHIDQEMRELRSQLVKSPKK